MKNIILHTICFFIGHKIPKWEKNPRESFFVMIDCLRCGCPQIESNFYYPWEKEYKEHELKNNNIIKEEKRILEAMLAAYRFTIGSMAPMTIKEIVELDQHTIEKILEELDSKLNQVRREERQEILKKVDLSEATLMQVIIDARREERQKLFKELKGIESACDNICWQTHQKKGIFAHLSGWLKEEDTKKGLNK